MVFEDLTPYSLNAAVASTVRIHSYYLFRLMGFGIALVLNVRRYIRHDCNAKNRLGELLKWAEYLLWACGAGEELQHDAFVACLYWPTMGHTQFVFNYLTNIASCSSQSFPFRSSALSTLFPSSSCSSTLRSGKRRGIIRRGVAPSTTEYFEKSCTPRFWRRKSSSSSSCPLTVDGGALSMARMESEKIVCLVG